MLTLANSIKFLLVSRIDDIDIYEINKRYYKYLSYNDFLCLNGNVNQNKLLTAFENYYGGFLEVIGCEIDHNIANNWLHTITRKPQRTLNPLYHILLIQFLSQKFDNFFSEYVDLTKLCNHKVANEIKKINEYKENIIQYIKSNPNATRSVISAALYIERDYLLKHDPNWYKNILPKSCLINHNCVNTLNDSKKLILQFIIDNPSCTRSQIKSAHRNQYEQCKQYDIEWFNRSLPELRKNYMKNFNEKLYCCRNSILEYIEKQPTCNRNEIREKLKNEYNWLYKNDVHWFKNNLPISTGPRQSIKDSMLQEYRKALLSFLESAPNSTRNEIYKKLTKAYKYCFTNDKDWFEREMPRPTKHCERNYLKSFIDWNERDLEILEILMNANYFDDVVANSRKLTKSKIYNLLPTKYKTVIKYGLDKLPKSKLYIAEILKYNNS